mgnify:CR=1 FL=1
MILYDDSEYPVRDDLEAAHVAQFQRFGDAGTWGTGAQRLAVVATARQACIDAGILEAPDDGGPEEPEVELPKVVQDIVHQVAVTPKDIDQDFYKNMLMEEGVFCLKIKQILKKFRLETQIHFLEKNLKRVNILIL